MDNASYLTDQPFTDLDLAPELIRGLETAGFSHCTQIQQLALPLVLIDYWAEWCGPCKMIAPTLEEVASEYQGRVKVAKLNIDDNPGTPPKYGIRSIPTLMLFKSGQVEATKVGAVSKAQLTAFLDENL